MSKPKDLAQLGALYARALAKDLAGLVGSEVKVKGPVIDVVAHDDTYTDGESIAHTVCVPKDDSSGIVHMLTPTVDAVVLASLLMGFTGPLIAEKRKSGFDEELLDAFGEVMNLGAASLGRVLSEQEHIPDLRSSGTQEIAVPDADDEWLPEGWFRRARYTLELPEDQGNGTLDLLFPVEQADEWFGSLDGSEDKPRPRKKMEIDSTLAGSGPIVFVDADEDSRQAAEDLEDDLDRSIWAFSPDEFGPEMLVEVEEASAFVIAWNLGGRSGLDVMETLKADARTTAIPVVLASPEPTQNMVIAALHAGAHSFAFQPYDSKELRIRLVGVLGMKEEDDDSGAADEKPKDSADDSSSESAPDQPAG